MSVRLSITARTRSLPSLFAFAESLASLSRVDSPPSKTIDTCRRVAPFPKVSKSKPPSDSRTKYLVYRDLRDRGYLVRESEGGFDFETFGKGATRRQVSIVFEGGESTLERLARDRKSVV